MSTKCERSVYPWFEINQDRAGDVPRVIALHTAPLDQPHIRQVHFLYMPRSFGGGKSHLVEEDVLPVTAFGRKVFQVAVLVDTVLLAELLPELAPDCAD
jgi:hypothetical protein